MVKSKKNDLILTIIIFGVMAAMWLLFDLKPLIGFIITTLVPSLYLIFREKKNFTKIFWAVFIFGGILGFIFDFLETLNKGWLVSRLIIPWKIFGVLPVDDYLTFFLMTFFIVIFYEHFLDDEKRKLVSENIMWALIPSLIILLALIIFFPINPNLFSIPYVYLVGGTIAIIPTAIISFYKPKLFVKFLKIAASFFFVWLITDIVALKTGAWYYPGEYVGKVQIFGAIFPFEELFFWMMLYASSIVAYYELFVDDLR